MSDHTMDLPPATAPGMASKAKAIRTEAGFALEIRRFLDSRRIEAAIPPRLKRQGLKVEHYERIGGLTNQNYKLHQGEDAVVLRLPGRGTGRFIDRRSERANQEAAARAGFTPHSLFFDGNTGVKITRYLKGAVALDAQTARLPERRAAVAKLLSRFHASGLKFVKEFNVFRMAKTYERVARGRFVRFYDCFGPVRERVLALETALASISVKPVACHNDLVPENILLTASGLTLIDWEYSGMNDPAWDLASFSLESAFDDSEEAAFLRSYCGKAPAPGLLLRVEAYKMLQDYLWSLWSLLQESASREHERARYYRNYGRFRYERALLRLPGVEAGLASLGGGKGGKTR